MSRYLQQLVQRAAGRGPWAVAAPARLPGAIPDLQRPGPPLVEPASPPSPLADMATADTVTAPPPPSREHVPPVGRDPVEPADGKPVVPAQSPPGKLEPVAIESWPPAGPPEVQSRTSEVSVSGT